MSKENKVRENKVRIYNRLFFKLYLNYAVMLLVTAVLICLIFMRLYEETTIKNNRGKLLEQAYNISSKASEYITYGKPGDFLGFIIDLEEITGMDIWTVANPHAAYPMYEMETTSFEEIVANNVEYEEILNSAFQNKPDNRTGHDDIYQKSMIKMAVPVIGRNNEVVGAVLLQSEVEGQKEIIYNSLSLIIFSSVIALAISFVIIIVFATELSLPISRIRITALELATGNYKMKTGIKRDDEIGDLSKAVDILSEKLLENEIQRKKLDQMRLDFFANVSHELRTPITVLRAYTETLVDGVVRDEEKIRQYYDRMLSECKSMERLVGDLLLLSKMQNPDFTIEKEPISLLEIMEEIIRNAREIAKKKNIRIEFSHEGTEPVILGDFDRIKQMFMIIFDNAIKFSNENGSVFIKIIKSDKIIVSIRDQGIGIEESDLGNIFEKFYKSNLRQNASGTGLGLAIAKQIVLKHKGEIDVKSKLGFGTEFIFTFPCYEFEE